MKTLSKLSTARGIARSRVWLEGKRLADHGFAHGVAYDAQWERGALVLRPSAEGKRHIAGTPARPIVDITGEHIRDAFGANAYVAVTYSRDVITIRATGEVRE